MCADPTLGHRFLPPCRQQRSRGGDVVLSRAAVVQGLRELLELLELLEPGRSGSCSEELLMGGIFIPPRNEHCRQEPRTGSSILWQHRQAAQTVLEVAQNRCERGDF